MFVLRCSNRHVIRLIQSHACHADKFTFSKAVCCWRIGLQKCSYAKHATHTCDILRWQCWQTATLVHLDMGNLRVSPRGRDDITALYTDEQRPQQRSYHRMPALRTEPDTWTWCRSGIDQSPTSATFRVIRAWTAVNLQNSSRCFARDHVSANISAHICQA